VWLNHERRLDGEVVGLVECIYRLQHHTKSRSGADRGRYAPYAILHHLVLSHARTFCLHNITSICVCVLDVGEAKRPSAVLITGKFSCNHSLACCCRPTNNPISHIPIAVSASSAALNSTTPVPRERPLGSYWISALSTFPMVVKSSTRSSLLVDQGSCPVISRGVLLLWK
jgi:hypothetical protein